MSNSGQSGLCSRSGFCCRVSVILEDVLASEFWIGVEIDPATALAVAAGLNGLSTVSLNLRTLRLPKPGQANSCSGVAWTISEKDCRTSSATSLPWRTIHTPKFERKVMTSVLFTLLIEVRTEVRMELWSCAKRLGRVSWNLSDYNTFSERSLIKSGGLCSNILYVDR